MFVCVCVLWDSKKENDISFETNLWLIEFHWMLHFLKHQKIVFQSRFGFISDHLPMQALLKLGDNSISHFVGLCIQNHRNRYIGLCQTNIIKNNIWDAILYHGTFPHIFFWSVFGYLYLDKMNLWKSQYVLILKQQIFATVSFYEWCGALPCGNKWESIRLRATFKRFREMTMKMSCMEFGCKPMNMRNRMVCLQASLVVLIFVTQACYLELWQAKEILTRNVLNIDLWTSLC